MIPAGEQWGPFAPGLDAAERVARLRCLRAISHLSCGPRGERLVTALRLAESGACNLEIIVAELNALAPIDRRRVWASYAAINRPA